MFEIDVSTNAVKALDGYAARLRSFREPLTETGAFLERQAKLRFVTQTDPSGQKWAPLRPSTLRYKKPGLPILTNTGTMRASIAFNVSGDEVRVKPSVEYAIFPQLGTKRMQARPFMGFEPGDAAAIGGFFRDYLERG